MGESKKAESTSKTVAYLRVSTSSQDLEKNKHEILELANNKDFGKVEWVEEKVSGRKCWKDRKIKDVIDMLDRGDRIIVPELSRLGRSMLEIMEMLSVLNQKEVCIYAVKGGWEIRRYENEILAMCHRIGSAPCLDRVRGQNVASGWILGRGCSIRARDLEPPPGRRRSKHND